MTTDRHLPEDLVQRLLEARALEPPARQVFLAQNFPDQSESFFETAALLLDGDALPNPAGQDTGEVGGEIGPYRLETLLGEGGMGRVFLAVNSQQPEQRVALKTIRPEFINPSFLNRFERERQILARLHHPHIAALYSVGATRGRAPFLAMEYVDGTSIDQYCRQNNLGLRRLLTLFLQICDALAFAHQNLVIHRDIKPSNVMVDGHGQVKLLDFGIAGLIDEETRQTGDLTQVDERMLSPDYAAPEHIAGEVLSTASDVYMLGALLYRLLTGHTPYCPEGTNAFTRYQAMINGRLEAPSRKVREPAPATGTTAVVRLLRRLPTSRLRDLDAILAKALHTNPTQRYQAVDHFAADLRAWLAFGPLSVDNPHGLRRLWRYCLRHRRLVAGSLGFCLLMAGFSTYLVHQSRQLQHERDVAQLERDTAERVTQFMVELFEGGQALDNLQKEVSAREILDQGARAIRTELGNEPEVKARMQLAMGRAYQAINQDELALELLEAGLAHYRGTDADLTTLFEIQESINQVWLNQGRFAELERQLLKMIATAETVRTEKSELYFRAHNALAEVYLNQGQFNESEAELLKITAEPDFPTAPLIIQTAVFNNLGLLYQVQSRYQECLGYFEQVLKNIEILFPPPHREPAKAHCNLGTLYSSLGDYDKSEQHYLTALAMYPEVFGEQHGETAKLLANIAVLYHNQNKLQKAVEFYLRAREQLMIFFPSNHHYVAQNNLSLSSAYLIQGELDLAEKYARFALNDMTGQSEASPAILAQGYMRLAAVLIHKGELEEAEALLDRHQATLPAEIDLNHPSRANNALYRGMVYRAAGKREQAITQFAEAERIYLTRVAETHRWVQRARIYQARTLTDATRFDEAETRLLEVQKTIVASGQDHTRLHQECLEALVELFQAKKETARAAPYEKELAALANPG